MGLYFNPGNENFAEISKMEWYVDKTKMLTITNSMIGTAEKYICMSRPRRFGKTVTGNMLAAYYSKGCDSAELFSGLNISTLSGYRDFLNKYNVIYIDMNSEYQNTKDKEKLITGLNGKICSEIATEYPEITVENDNTLAEAILKVYSAKGDTFIVIIDEYDVLVREQVPEALFEEFLSFLNGLFKSNTLRPAISLAYLTGILPVVRDRIQSKLNNFDEYTFLNAGRFTEYIGFTSDEVKELCQNYSIDFEECRSWYDGYFQNGCEIYNPESVVKCIKDKYFDSYWGKTSTYKVISDRLQQNYKGLRDCVIRMLAGESIDVNVTSFLNTMDSFESRNDVFTYLIHLGYLAYDRETKTCRIPNREIRQEWHNAVENDEEYSVTNEIIEKSKELLEETIKGNESAVAAALDTSHIHVTSNRSYNNEDALQSAIYLSYIYALNKYTVVKEMTAGKGFADVVFIPFVQEYPAMIIELKRNKSSESAINQIKEKKYFDSLEHYKGNLIFVGINYDEDSKTHDCSIVRFEK
ncbi:MAG: AAA family ATPase [Butyrivibrio sp.]|nr:AAA family ATPase [Butyrivibrio sp.]